MFKALPLSVVTTDVSWLRKHSNVIVIHQCKLWYTQCALRVPPLMPPNGILIITTIKAAHLTRMEEDSKMLKQEKTPATNSHNLSAIPGLTWKKERSDSQKLSSNLHLSAYTHTHVHTRAHTLTNTTNKHNGWSQL